MTSRFAVNVKKYIQGCLRTTWEIWFLYGSLLCKNRRFEM